MGEIASTVSPPPPNNFRGLKLLPKHVPHRGPLGKEISAPQPLSGGDMGVKGKFSPHAPSKSSRCIRPKFGPGPALDAAYEWPKFGEPSTHSFGARAKSAVFQRPRSTTGTKTLERSQMILLHSNG